jgi:predicted kinase
VTRKLILTRGLPASGKSTFAVEWVREDPTWRIRVNRDDLRAMTHGEFVLDRMREDTLTTGQAALVTALLQAGQQVIVDDTNLTARFVKEWLRIAQRTGAEVEFVDFETPLEECLRRNKARADAGGRFVPEDVIRGYASRFMRKGKLPAPPTLDPVLEVREKYVPDESLPHAYLVDIDGTVADMSGSGRNPFDWDRVGEDEPIKNVIELVKRLYMSGASVVFMSGRDAVSRAASTAWLNIHLPEIFVELYMRPEGDMRKDSIVKHELFYKYVASKYHVVGVIDDRQQVVDMWREIGLTTFQCAPGDF